MKNKEHFESTVAILLDAYRNDTLKHNSCYACAVGNIVAGCNGYTFIKDNDRIKWNNLRLPFWNWVFVTDSDTKRQSMHLDVLDSKSPMYNVWAEHQIVSTGYSVEQLAKIEYAFETAPVGESKDEWMFNGLLAVYDVLCDIHEVNKEEVKKGEEVFV